MSPPTQVVYLFYKSGKAPSRALQASASLHTWLLLEESPDSLCLLAGMFRFRGNCFTTHSENFYPTKLSPGLRLDLFINETSLVYISSSRLARASEWDPVSKTKKKTVRYDQSIPLVRTVHGCFPPLELLCWLNSVHQWVYQWLLNLLYLFNFSFLPDSLHGFVSSTCERKETFWGWRVGSVVKSTRLIFQRSWVQFPATTW